MQNLALEKYWDIQIQVEKKHIFEQQFVGG